MLGWDITKKAFWNSFVETEWIENNDGYKMQVVVGYKNVERLKRKLGQHGAVFMKTEEVFDLPSQTEIITKCNKTSEYRKFMKNSIITITKREFIEWKRCCP